MFQAMLANATRICEASSAYYTALTPVSFTLFTISFISEAIRSRRSRLLPHWKRETASAQPL